MKYKGLTTQKAKKQQEKFGLNEIQEKKAGAITVFLKKLVSPIYLMLLAAALLSFSVGKIFDFYFILVLLFINFFVGFWQEKKADKAIEKLREKLSVETTVLRNGRWQDIHSREIVPGDIIELMLGNVIPADIKILEEKNLSVNEAQLTGESMPKDKKPQDLCYSGSFVASGWAIAEVEKIGSDTYFGHILVSLDTKYKRSLLEKDILSISKMLSVLSFIAVIILSSIFIFKGNSFVELLTLDLSLIIAGIPISLPTIMTLIISFGVVDLAKKKAVVRRLSALEDLANVNVLLSDKTGTLTKNEINVEKIIPYNNFSEKEILFLASITAREHDKNSINQAILRKIDGFSSKKTSASIIDFIPFDSNRKRSTVVAKISGEKTLVSAGATQVIEPMCLITKETGEKFDRDVENAARQGYRVVAVAVGYNKKTEEHLNLVGLLFFSDTLEKGDKETINFIKQNGIEIKMLTGDNHLIAERVAKQIGLTGKTTTPQMIGSNFNRISKKGFDRSSVFAEILPSDKSALVEAARSMNYTVAVTGDGVNDLPALKTADVGIAVKNAVDALKSTADLTLFTHGVTVIKDAIIESRKIFSRLYSYSVYRISESFRIIITIAVLGILYENYPLTPIQLILLALLNDIPIISLAFNRVKIAKKPSSINAKERLKLSTAFGMVGTINSLLFFLIIKNIFQFDWNIIQTLFFLKLTVSGHMLIYVAHTKERWWRYLPSKEVILATGLTQLIGTFFAAAGIFMAKVNIKWIIFVWIWAIFWTQVSELTKYLNQKFKS